MIPAFEEECVKEAKVRSVSLPSDWSVGGLLQEFREVMTDVQSAILKTAATLRQKGTHIKYTHALKDTVRKYHTHFCIRTILQGSVHIIILKGYDSNRPTSPSSTIRVTDSCVGQSLGRWRCSWRGYRSPSLSAGCPFWPGPPVLPFRSQGPWGRHVQLRSAAPGSDIKTGRGHSYINYINPTTTTTVTSTFDNKKNLYLIKLCL